MERTPLVEEWYDGERRVLSNGMTLWSKSWPKAKTYGMAIAVSVGSVEDPPDRPGCAHCFEHIVFRGAGPFPSSLALVDFIEEHDGRCNASTGRDETSYWIEADQRVLGHALDALYAIVSSPHFQGIETERKTILREYHEALAHPLHRAIEEFLALLFREDSHWGHPVIGTENSITTMTAKHLAAFHRAWYAPGRMAAAIVGPGDTPAMLDDLERRLLMFPFRGEHHLTAEFPVIPKVLRGKHEGRWDLPATVLTCGNVFRSDLALYRTARLLCGMLGEGTSSPILQRLREERAYFYTYSLGISAQRGFHIIGFDCPVADERADACWDGFWKLVSPNTGVCARRWEWMQRRLTAGLQHGEFSPLHVAKKAASDLVSYGHVVQRNERAAAYRKISLQDVQAFAEEYFAPRTCLQVTFWPARAS